MRKCFAIGALVLLVAGLAGLAYFEASKRAWIRINEFDIRSEGLLQVGDLAPDVDLLTTDGAPPVRVSDLYADKPLVLTFGSYT